jgi:hypothetical protein
MGTKKLKVGFLTFASKRLLSQLRETDGEKEDPEGKTIMRIRTE